MRKIHQEEIDKLKLELELIDEIISDLQYKQQFIKHQIQELKKLKGDK